LPITPSVNAILVRRAETHTVTRNPQPCIRCGACAEVCPASLLPQQLYWHAHARQLKQALDHHLSDCIECGCCDAVCPSQIPLVREFQQAKQAALAEKQARNNAAHAKMRFEARQARLLQEQRDREIAARQRKASLDQGASSKIQEVLERARQKHTQKGQSPEER
jgi:electron transport complex protein RnfC